MKTHLRFIPLLAIASIALSACSPSADKVVGFDTTPEIGDVIHFSGSTTTDGWNIQPSGGTGINATVDAEHPDPSVKGNCYFSRTVEYLPEGYASRGDDYNSKQFVYDMGSSFRNFDPEVKTITVGTEKSPIELISSSVSYDDPSAGKTTTRFAVRAISEVKKSGYDVKNAPESPYAKNAGEGVPVIFLKADCVKGETLSDDDWNKLMESTKISLDSPVPTVTDIPSLNNGPLAPAPMTTGASQPASPAPSTSSSAIPSDDPK